MACPPDCPDVRQPSGSPGQNDNSDGLGWARQLGRQLRPFQRTFEPVALVVVNVPLLGMGTLAGSAFSAEVLALGNTLRSGAGSGILTAAGVAGRVAEAVGGTVEPLAKSEGFKVQVMEG